MAGLRSSGGVTVRPYARGDAAGLHAAVMASIGSLSRTLPWCHAGYSQQDAAQWVESGIAGWSAGTDYPLGIFDDAGELIGGTGLSRVDRTSNMANIGYWVREGRRRAGVATTAARLAAEIGFFELGFTRLEIVVLPGNLASLGVVRRLGATFEALARNRAVHDGRPADALVYSLVPADIAGPAPAHP